MGAAQYALPSDQALNDVYACQFTTDAGDVVLLHQQLKSWQDKIAFRNAVHEYLQRDGAEIQPMGRKPAEFTLNCFYLGPTWKAAYGSLVNALTKSSKGNFVHPLLSQMRAAIDGIEGTSTPATGKQLIEFAVRIIEDRVDSSLGTSDGSTQPTPAAAAGVATNLLGQLNDAATAAPPNGTMPWGQISLAMGFYQNLAETYIAAAENAVGTLAIDPVLDITLSQAGAAADAAMAAVLADPACYTDAYGYPLLTLIEQSYASCLDLDDAVQQQLPVPEMVTIDVPISLWQLCENRYGGPQTPSYMDFIMLINPHLIPNPAQIPGGVQLLLPPKTQV